MRRAPRSAWGRSWPRCSLVHSCVHSWWYHRWPTCAKLADQRVPPQVAWSLTNGATSPPFNHFFVFLISAVIMLLISAMAFAMPRSLEQPLPEDAEDAGGEGAGAGEKASLLRASEEE